MASASDARFVQLKGGPLIPVEPVLLVLELEARGFLLSWDGADIWIRPASPLTDEDRARVVRWKPQVQ